MIAYKNKILGPRIHAENRNIPLNPNVVIAGPLINSPVSSPAFIKLMRMEN